MAMRQQFGANVAVAVWNFERIRLGAVIGGSRTGEELVHASAKNRASEIREGMAKAAFASSRMEKLYRP